MTSDGAVSAPKRTSSLWKRAALFSVGYFLCAQIGSYLSVRQGMFVDFWLPAGLTMAVLLLNRTRDWPWLLLATFPAHLLFDFLHGIKFPIFFFYYCADIVESFTGAWLVRTFVADCPGLKTLKEFVGLVAFGAVFNSMLGAVIGAAAQVHFGFNNSFVHSWSIWWGSNAMAIVVLTPFILTWFYNPNDWRRAFNSAKKIMEAVLLLLGLSTCMWFLLELQNGIMSPNKSILIPFLLWAGLRFGVFGATAVNLYLALALSFFSGPLFSKALSPVSSGEFLFVLQTVVAMSALITLVPAIVLSERDRTMTKLRESEERYRNLTDAAFEGIGISENGLVVDANEQMLKIFGYEREEMIGRKIVDLVAPESRAIVAEAIRTGHENIYEHAILRKDGSSFIVEARGKNVFMGGRTLRMTAVRDITARKKVEQALRESEEKFSKAFHNSPDVMSITDLETSRYIEVNDAHEKIFGFKREEVLGRTPVELGIFQNCPEREEMMQSLKAQGRFTNREAHGRACDGRVVMLLHSAELIELGGRMCVLRVSHDITDAKRAEEALRESEQRFRSYFELASVGFAITSREMRLLSVNTEYCRILGYSQEELLQKTWAELTYRDDLSANQILFEETAEGKRDAYTLNKRMIRKDGHVIHTTISARCIRLPDGSPDYFVSLLLDTTEREQAIEREQKARAEYTLQLIASQEAERARIAGELHDSLGQSLSVIKNHAQLALLQKNLSAQAHKQIETISEATSVAIAEMRRISQDLHPYQLDHLGLTRALGALVEGAGEASGIAFKKKLDLVDDAFSRDAAASVYRIVQEGVNNVLKYSHAKNSRVALERDLHEVQLTIEDDGRGFNPENNGKGMGLKNIAERTRILGGQLKMDSRPGRGARLEITIPIRAEPELNIAELCKS